VGKPKAEVAAARIMERVGGVTVVPHFCRIEDKPVDWYRDFHVIALGLDSLEVRARASHSSCLSTGVDASRFTVSQARNYINGVVCSFLGECTCNFMCNCKAITPALCAQSLRRTAPLTWPRSSPWWTAARRGSRRVTERVLADMPGVCDCSSTT
jgi:molybdopterin/thiamine biosynthesis adenylyltransferase